MGRFFRWLFALGVLAVIAAACAVALVLAITGKSPGEALRQVAAQLSILGRDDEINAPFRAGDTESQRFDIEPGDTPAQIADWLVTYGYIGDGDLFVNYARSQGLDTQFEAGTYFIRRSQSIAEIAHQLTDSANSFIPFRVLEGWRLEEIAEAIDANPMFGFSGAEFIAATYAPLPFRQSLGIPDGANLEGFLYPDTYRLAPDTTAEGLVETLTTAFMMAVGPELMDDVLNQGRTLREVVNLAAIVQREALHADEMPLIAGVYQNRLDIEMKLDADPTVQYALGNSRGAWWPQITVADYSAVNSAYNTYLVIGLPPSPISNPGLAALQAAVYPTASEYYYFRADCRDDGYHDFAPTYEEHIANGC